MKEAELHQNLCDYLRLQHRGVLFRSDFGSGVKLTIGQAARQKRLQSERAFPDLFIIEGRYSKQDLTIYNGLFLELKAEGTKLFLKDGVTMVANPHYREQAAVLEKLRERGYKAVFVVGFDAARKVIDEYLAK